ncbi:dystonin-like, partial [Stegodyphus dumicola]|uniref:dystonin-like n=1 Tax=Stegodyphus dumicola TaxID=202533 RepID=UPI0015ADF38C
ISDIITHQTDERITAKEALLRWAQRTTDKYPGVRVGDFTRSWRDGLAFNAIIHRNRPDLVDYRSCLKRSARDNLDSAFTIAERELNVTKLLDPEDVDTHEPDEKSLITYISSLYDVFPRPPAHNPFAVDDEKTRKVEEYKELASSLFLWMRESLSLLQDRSFPNTLVEMKSLLAECTRFRVEDIPPRLHEKQRLTHLYREIQKSHRDIISLEISDELHMESIERYWNRVMLAHQERDQAIHDEIARLEKLQRLAEKVHRETKQCDGKMDDIERHIAEEEKRVQRLHPSDAKHNCDQIENELKHVEESLKSMSRDVQTLRDGRYHQALELQKRVQQLHERFLNIRLNFQTRLLNVLATRSLKTEEKKVSKPRPLSLEKLIETNKAFKFLQECIDWVHKKLKYLEEADYGTDLPSVQSLLEQHHTEHRLIDQFQKNVDQCSSQRTQFKGEELELYCKLLSRLEKGYSEVLVMSNKRMSDLDTLLDFIQSATNELIWMNEKEEIEVSRDWSAKSLNISEIEEYQKALTIELEKREVHFNAVQDRGESLVLQKHPASKCIEAYLAAMQTQWSWLLQLMSCLEVHLKYAYIYHQFFNEAKECQQWLKQIENRLSTTYSRQNFSIDEGERLMKEMQELRDELSHYSNVVSSLIERSKDIAPLKQRRQPLPRPLRVTAICSYKQQSMSVNKDEQCWLHDNSNKTKWKIINAHGVEGMVPGVCFVIPPPNPEALELAESLKRQFETIVNLWTSKQRKLRQNMIFATIKIIKSWDITKFRSIEPIQRESIIKALNEDTQKLLNEGSSDDPALKRLQEEIAYCNKLFADLQRMLDQDEVDRINKSQARKFNDLVASVQSTLTEKERTLKQRTQAPIPRSKEIVGQLMQEQKDFESDLQTIEPRICEVREAFRELTTKTPALQSRYDGVMESWNNLWSVSNLYVERMKAVELTLGQYEEATQVVSNVELQLVSYDEMPSDVESSTRVEESLKTLKREMQHKQVMFEQISQSVSSVRHYVELSRPHQTVHTDVSKLEEDVKKVRRRWDLAGTQVADRLRALETSMDLLQSYKGKYNEQKVFVSQMCAKVESLKSVSRLEAQEMHHEIESSMSTYHTLSQRKAAIEDVNVDGGRFVREAKIYDLLLKQYQEGLDDNPAASDAKKAKLLSGAEIVSQELDVLNQEYTDLVNTVLQRLNELKSLVSSQEGQKFSVTIIQAAPITLKTYCTELILEQVPYSLSHKTNYINHTSLNTSVSSTGENTTEHLQTNNSFQHDLYKSYLPYEIHKKESPKTPYTTVLDISMDVENSASEKDELLEYAGTSLSFTEVKCSQRSVFFNCSNQTIFEKKTIFDASTKSNISFNEALDKNIINMKTLCYLDSVRKMEYSFKEAVSLSYIDASFYNSIIQYYDITDPKNKKSITLLEAIQRKLFNPKTGKFMDSSNEKDLSVEEAVKLGIINKENVIYFIENNIINSIRYLIPEAVLKGYLDPDSGIFTSPYSAASFSIPEAYSLGYLYAASPIIEDSLSLTDALNSGLVVEDEGKICDPDSGNLLTINEALVHGVLSKRLREVVDPSIGNIVTIPNAINSKLIDPDTGCFLHPKDCQQLSLKEAQKRHLIMPSLTLKHAFEKGLIMENGEILNVLNSTKVSLIRAGVIGLLSLDVKCILYPDSDKLLTLAEALILGVITPDCKYFDIKSNEKISLAQAANRGYLAAVDKRMIFDIEGFRDTTINEYVSFNSAVSKSIIDKSSGYVQDLNTGQRMSMLEGIEHKLVIPQVFEMLNKNIGINDENGVEQTLLECVTKGLLDPQTGQIIDPGSKCPLRLMKAVQKGIISEEGAVTLKSLLNITVTLTAITKTTTRYVTVASRSFGTDLKITFDEAYERGLIDENRGTFKHPYSGNIMPIEEAISKGYLSILDSSKSEAHIYQSEETIFKNNVKFNKSASTVFEQQNFEAMGSDSLNENSENASMLDNKNSEINVPPDKIFSSVYNHFTPQGLFHQERKESTEILKESHVQTMHFETITEQNSSKNNLTSVHEPAFSLKTLLFEGILNPDSGYLSFKDSDEVMDLKSSITRGILDPMSALVVDNSTKKYIPLDLAIQQNILSPTGVYFLSNGQISMKEALDQSFIICISAKDSSPELLLQNEVNNQSVENNSIIFNKIFSNMKVDMVDIGVEVQNSTSLEKTCVEENLSSQNFQPNIQSNLEMSADSSDVSCMSINSDNKENILNGEILLNEASVKGLLLPFSSTECTTNSIAQNAIEFSVNGSISAVQSFENKSHTGMVINYSSANSSSLVKVSEHDVDSNIAPNLDTSACEDMSDKNKNVAEEDIDRNENKKRLSKSQYTVPRFEVTIGKAQSVKSPAKAVVLKKVKRKKVHPNYAAEKGITDEKTAATLKDIANLIGPDGQSLSLEEAVRLSFIDGSDGVIKNPKNNETLNINQAICDGLLDPESGHFILPVGRSLSIPEAVTQGLVEPVQQKIVHPEHGEHLSIQEAIVCEIIDPMSKMTEPVTGKNLTLENAIDAGVINGNNGEVQTCDGTMTMLEAVKQNIFETVASVEVNLPPLAPTFAVALRQGYIDLDKRNYIHPITNNVIPLFEAIDEGLIMTGDAKHLEDSIYLWTALENKLIDSVSCAIMHPNSRVSIPVEEAIDSGFLLITSEKPASIISSKGKQETGDNFQNVLIPGHLYMLCDLLNYGLLEVNRCILSVPYRKDKIPLASALAETVIFPDAIIQAENDQEVALVVNSAAEVNKSSPLNIATAISGGYYDEVNNTFLGPNTNDILSLDQLMKEHINELSFCKVKDKKTLAFFPLSEAMSRSLIDENSGMIFDEESSTSISCFEATSKCLIVYIPTEDRCVKNIRPMTFKESIERKFFDVESAELKIPLCFRCFSLSESLRLGLIERSSVLVYNPLKDVLISLIEACKASIIDINGDLFIHPITSQEISLKEAFKRGLIVPKRKPMSLEAAIKMGLVKSDCGVIVDPVTQQESNIEMSVRGGLIDPILTLIKDTKSDKLLTLEESMLRRLVLKSGKVKCTARNTLLNFQDALDEGIIQTQQLKLTLVEAIDQDYYDQHSGQFFNPLTGCNITLVEAVEMKFILEESAKVKSVKTCQFISLNESISLNILDATRGTYKLPQPVNLKYALDMGYIINYSMPLTLSEALELNLYDSQTELFNDFHQSEKPLEEMISAGYINGNAKTVFDMFSDEIVSLHDAIQRKMLDARKGCFRSPFDQSEMNLYDAYEQGIILPYKRKLTLLESINKIYYCPKSCSYYNPAMDLRLTILDAVESECIDVTKTLICDSVDQAIFSFADAVKQNIIDLSNGTLYLERLKQHITFQQAVERDIFMEVICMSVKDSINTGVYQESTGLFFNPFSSEHISLKAAINCGLIDPDTVKIKQVIEKTVLYISLEEAVEKNVVDPLKSLVYSPDGSLVPFNLAFEEGLIVENHPSISLQKAILDGLYDRSTGRFHIASHSKKLTLRECLNQNILDGNLPCYWDENSERLLSLNAVVRKQIINSTLGLFQSSKENHSIPLDEALEQGVLLDIEKTLTLYDALKFDLFVKSGKFFSPRNGLLITLRKACVDSLISPHTSFVKSPENKVITLCQAVNDGIIDDVNGRYIFIDTGETISLREAFSRQLIILFNKPYSFENVLNMKLFNPETGQFLDPISNQFLTVEEAVNNNLVKDDIMVHDHKTESLKSLRLSLTDGTIDVTSGTLKDPNSHCSISLDKAFEQNFIISLGPEFLQNFMQNKNFSDLCSFHRVECTVEEAIQKKLMNPDKNFIRDHNDAQLITVKHAIENGMINLRKKLVFCHISKRTNSLVIHYEEQQIFARKPNSLSETIMEKSLNVLSGMFTEPNSKQIFTLKEAVDLGYIDCGSAVVKDTKRRQFSNLKFAFENNTLDSDRGMVINTMTNQVLTLNGAISSGLMLTYPYSFNLTDALDYDMYDKNTNMIRNPFTNMYETLSKAVASGLINPSTTLVKDTASGCFYDLNIALDKGIICPETGCLMNVGNGDSTTLMDAYQRGLLVPSEKRVAIEEKYRQCSDTISKLLAWLQEKEMELAELGLVKEEADELYRQINSAKSIKQDLEDHQRSIMSCIDQAQQLIEQGQDVLSKDEIHNIQKNSEALKKRFTKANEDSEKLLRRLNTASEELQKFSNELINFMEWLKDSHLKQTEKERSLVDLDHLKENADAYKTFSSDAIAHQADLRFITMAAQKFVDESKDYLRVLNDFRTSLPRRLGHLEPTDSEVKAKVQEVSTAFQNLLNRIDKLGDKFSNLFSKQRNFADCMEKASMWLNSIQKNAKKVVEEPAAADPRAIQDQLDRVKVLNMELIQQGRLIDAAKESARVLLDALEDSDISPLEKQAISNKVKGLEQDYNDLCNMVNAKSNELQMALLHSQDIQDGLDRILKWLDDTETNLKNQSRPVSLIKEKLEEQIQMHKMLLSDIDGQKPTLDAVNDSARELLNSSNQRLAKKIESKLKDVNLKFEKLCEKAQKRSDLLEEVCKALGAFSTLATKFEDWLTTMLEITRNKDQSRSDGSSLSVIEDVINQRDARKEEFEEILRSGKVLVGKRDVTDTSIVKDKMKSLEQQWKELGDLVAEQHRKNKERAEQLSAYEALRAKVLEWLSSMEIRVDNLEPVALDKEVLRRQSLEIKTLAKEHADYAPTIDKINDLGNSYEAMLKGDSPRHFSGSPSRKPSSPTRLSPTKHRKSPDYGSPSGRGIQSPLSSMSSGFSSSRSSADNLGGIEDLTPIQQQLSEINHRYSLLGVKLSDRSQEINSFSDEIKVYLDNLKNLLNFVQAKERQLPKDPLPVTREQAAKQLQALKAIQEDMLERQLEVDRLKNQTDDLARRKPATPGIDNLMVQMSDLGQRWNELLSAVKEKSKFLQDLKDFQDSQDAMNNWLGQKEKMFQVLGPIASDPRMVNSQIQQVQ